MDGGGRLDQPLMRSGPKQAERGGPLVDAAACARPKSVSPRLAGSLCLVAAVMRWARRRFVGRWTCACAAAAARVSASPASILLLAATLGYGAVAGGHVADVIDWLKDARDGAANSRRLPHRRDFADRPEGSQPRRNTHHRRRDRPRLAVVPRRRRGADTAVGQSLDRRRGGAQALSRPSADHHHRAPGLRAVAEGRARQRHRRRRHRARTVRRGPLSRPAAGGRHAAPSAQAKDFLAVLDRYPDIRSQLRASVLVAERRWNLRLNNGIDVRLPEGDVEQALERLVELDREKKLLSRDIVAVDLRLPDRVTRAAVRRSGAGPRGRAQGQEEEKGGRRMSALHYGLTPKMKPISPRRSALVAALDIGSSKIACLIARLRPHAPQQVLTAPKPRHRGGRLRPCRPRAAPRPAAWSIWRRPKKPSARPSMAPSAWHRSRSKSVVLSISAGRLASELFAAEIDIAGTAVSEGDIARVLGRRQPAFDARRPRRAAFAADRLFDRRRQRHPRSARHARRALRRRHACGDHRRRGGAQPDACGRALSSRRRGDGREPLCRRPRRAGRRRSRSRRRGRRHGRRHHDDGGVSRRPASFMPTVSRSAATTSPWTSRAGSTPASPMPSESRRFMAVCWSVDRTNAT